MMYVCARMLSFMCGHSYIRTCVQASVSMPLRVRPALNFNFSLSSLSRTLHTECDAPASGAGSRCKIRAKCSPACSRPECKCILFLLETSAAVAFNLLPYCTLPPFLTPSRIPCCFLRVSVPQRLLAFLDPRVTVYEKSKPAAARKKGIIGRRRHGAESQGKHRNKVRDQGLPPGQISSRN